MSARTVEAKFIDGPMAGRTTVVPANTERIDVGPLPRPFWVYTYAGKENQRVLFAKQPTQRKTRRFIHWYVGKHGRDPRVKP